MPLRALLNQCTSYSAQCTDF